MALSLFALRHRDDKMSLVEEFFAEREGDYIGDFELEGRESDILNVFIDKDRNRFPALIKIRGYYFDAEWSGVELRQLAKEIDELRSSSDVESKSPLRPCLDWFAEMIPKVQETGGSICVAPD